MPFLITTMKTSRLKQYLCAFNVILLTSAFYQLLNWPSPTIPLLVSPNSPIGVQLSKEEASWVASAKSLGMLPGAIGMGLLMDKVGPKKCLFLGGLLMSICWIIVIFSMSFSMLLAAQIIGGFGSSSVSCVASIYLSEISETDIRGRITIIPTMGSAVGAILVLGIGPFVSFTTLALMCALLPTLFCASVYYLPESPYFLIKNNRRDAAYEVLKSLSKTASTDAWLQEIESTVQKDEQCELGVKQLFVKVNYRKSLLIIIAMKTLQQFSGLFAISSYLQTIMKESQTSLSPETSSLIFAVIDVPSVVLSAWLVDKLGRRILLIISASGCATALIGEGIYFYLLQVVKADLSSVHFLPTLCITVYLMMIPIGLGTLLYVVLGELFTTNMKKVGGSVFAFYSGLLSFVSVKIFNGISETCGMYTTFWIFGCVCILGVFFGLFMLPETKGKSFEQIQDMLNGCKKHVDSRVPDSAVISHM